MSLFRSRHTGKPIHNYREPKWQIHAYPSYQVLDGQHGVARRDIGYSSQLGLWWRAWTVN
jgi:hypothetical protein